MTTEPVRSRWGLLLVNLGTPDSYQTGDVRRYLREFLSDPRVLDINPVGRTALLELIILPTRPKESGHAYSKVWTERGSPLLFYGHDLVDKVQARLGDGVSVVLAMRYQNPSIAAALEHFMREGVDRVLVLPLFPQYSSAANGSAIEKVFVEAGRGWNIPSLAFVEEFYDHPLFLDAFAAVARPVLEREQPDRVVMSFHGLPERHVRKSDTSPDASWCLAKDSCCDAIMPANRFCYRAQCFATARGLAQRLGLDDYDVAFQSRLGRDPWIQPYTDELINRLADEGIKKVAVLCPAFVADCLETLEEIGMRADEDFRARGGDSVVLVPSLNAEDVWADAVAQMALDYAPPAWRRTA